MKLSTYQTANGNWRVLVSGNVHPLLCGFDSEREAFIGALDLFGPKIEVLMTNHVLHPQHNKVRYYHDRPADVLAHDAALARFEAQAQNDEQPADTSQRWWWPWGKRA